MLYFELLLLFLECCRSRSDCREPAAGAGLTGAVVIELCELEGWRACVRFRRLPFNYSGIPRTGSGLEWAGRRMAVSVYVRGVAHFGDVRDRLGNL